MSPRKNPIKDEVTRREIQYLMHFTQVQNLSDIVKYGILPRARLDELDVTYYTTCLSRLDQDNGAISVSISAINYAMLLVKDRDCGHPKWVVLLLNPSILWTHSCRFYYENAGTNEMLYRRPYLGGSNAFSRMFMDECRTSRFTGTSYRAETGIPDYFTTYPDAEVQVLQPIHPDLIVGAWVWENENLAIKVQEQLDILSGQERTTYGYPWKTFCNDHAVWLIPDGS
jgi:hypothetical protein